MCKLQKCISAIVLLCMMFATVFFNTQINAFSVNNTFESSKTDMSISEQLLSAENNTEIYNMFGETDNSALEVNVVWQNGTRKEVIYSGCLGDYAFGIYRYIDFTNIDYQIIFTTAGITDDVIYIVPKSQKNIDEVIDALTPDGNGKLTSDAIVNANEVSCSVNLMYDNAYYERIMIKTGRLSLPLRITNTNTEEKDITCIIADYDMNETLIKETAYATIKVNSDSSVAVLLNHTFDQAAKSAKIFIWENGTLRPVTDSIILTDEEIDFYADDLSTAQEYDITYQINGKINTTNDVDCIKFIPDISGKYTFNHISPSNITVSLYDSSQNQLKSSSSPFEYSITSGQTYYIKISANSITEYVLDINRGTYSANSDFDIYDFDVSANILKTNIYKQCGNIYYENTAAAKEVYDELQKLLAEDLKLHKLPGFLKNGSKNTENYDSLVNDYLSVKSDKFSALYEKYENLLEKANNIPSEQTEDEELSSEIINTNINMQCPPLSAKGCLLSVNKDGNVTMVNKDSDTEFSASGNRFDVTTESKETMKNGNEHKNTSSFSASEADDILTIQSKTASSITFRIDFPTGAKLRTVYMYNFNTSDGLTEYQTLWTKNSKPKTDVSDGTYTISGLVPGGIYIISAMWGYSTTGNYGGENTIHRWTQLPYNDDEALMNFTGKYVSASIEENDASAAKSDNISDWVLNMDKVYETLQSFTGYTPYNGKKIELKSAREDFSANQPDGENYWRLIMGLSGNPIKISQPFYKSHMKRLTRDDLGDTPIHELSHDFDNDNWIFDHEALAYLKTAYVLEKLNAKVYRIDTEKWYTGSGYATFLKTDWLEGYDECFKNGIYSPAGLASVLLDIKKNIGWEAFSETFKYMGELSIQQIPDTELDILNLFLTCLGKYSNKNVFDMISNQDKEILADNFGGSIEEYIPPTADVPENANGRIADISVRKGDYKQYRFVPKTTGSYKIYTGAYAGAGVPNDTYIEVYAENSETESPIASNDDYGNSVFSSVELDLTKDTVYYIKVYNYNRDNGRLHARLNIRNNESAKALEEDIPQNVISGGTEYKMFKFTPSTSGVYVFTADGYNGLKQTYDTYIKLYDDNGFEDIIGQNENKIVVKLTEGHTYYLQFSGFLMKYAQGRVTVSKGQTLQFTKRSDSSFIYVNNPEYIANEDIVDDTETRNYKLFEQKNVYGKNTYYQTHLAWYNSDRDSRFYPKQNQFYIGIDFYNPNSYAVVVDINNLVATTNKTNLQNYINKTGENPDTITIQPQQHIQLFDNTNEKFVCIRSGDTPSLFVIYDFEVKKTTGASIPDGQGITVSAMAAYDYEKMRLKDGEENTLVYQNTPINNGDVLHGSARPTEHDLEIKYKGIARNQSNQIDVKLDFVIDDNTSGDIPFVLKDTGYLTNGNYAKEQADWNVQINPINDENEALLHTTADNLHSFNYRFNDSKKWYFDFMHRNTDYLDTSDYTDSANQEVAQNVINAAKNSILTGKILVGSRDENALQMGSWGVVYHYTVTVNNIGIKTKKVKYRVRTTAHYTLVGMREDSNDKYIFADTGTNESYQIPFEVDAPPGQKTFEFVTMCGSGNGGLENTIIIE